MLLIAEIVIICILLIVLLILIIEEEKLKNSKVPKGTVKEYWSGEERRQSLRINASLIVRYSVAKNFHIKLNGQTKDISSDGMKLLVNEKLNQGAVLILEFSLPDSENFINAQGKVIWSDGEFTERDQIGRRIFRMGIQFISIKQGDKNRLIGYIKEIAEKT